MRLCLILHWIRILLPTRSKIINYVIIFEAVEKKKKNKKNKKKKNKQQPAGSEVMPLASIK